MTDFRSLMETFIGDLRKKKKKKKKW